MREPLINGPTLDAALPAPADAVIPIESHDYLVHFKMPVPVKISGRSSSITNSFVNSIIPVVPPTGAEVHEVLRILEMVDAIACAYCGDPHTEWDHFRPLIVAKRPTGYISEIHNLVPACGKCNQSKGNKDWRTWMFGPAAQSPATRGIVDIDARAARLASFEAWRQPTRLDFADIVGEVWNQHEHNRLKIIELMREADVIAARLRQSIMAAFLGEQAPQPDAPGVDEPTETAARTQFYVHDGDSVRGPLPKNRAVLETVRAVVQAGVEVANIERILGTSRIRHVEGERAGEDLWDAMQAAYGLGPERRRLWFVEFPIVREGRTWVVANNVWGPGARAVMSDLCKMANGGVVITTSQDE